MKYIFGIMIFICFSLLSISHVFPADISDTSGGIAVEKSVKSQESLPFWKSINSLMEKVVGVALLLLILCLARLFNMRSELKKNQVKIEKIREKYRLMVENTDDGILIIQDFKCRFANKRVYEYMGLLKDGNISRNLMDYIFPDDLNTVLKNFKKPLQPNDLEINLSIRLVKKDKSLLWVHVRAVPVHWEDELAYLVFLRDITTRKIMEQDLSQAQRMEAIGALSGGIAHDFNNILTTIIGNAEVALMELSEHESGKDEFDQIRKAGFRARDLVRQILTISRESAMDSQPLSLASIVKEALKLLKSTLPKDIQIKENIDGQVKTVKADSIQMHQVFMNLCTNAKDALKNGSFPCLEVGLQNVTLGISDKKVSNDLKPGQYVALSVRDNGEGIQKEIEDKIFDPYFTTKDNETSSGLGLATTLGIVKQFNGHILYESEVGKGSCFTVYLPVYEMDGQNNPLPDKNIPIQGEGKILFVDDEKDIAVIAKRMLENSGFSVMIANSGKEALERFVRSPGFFDLLITDLSMPEMTGEKLVEKVLKIRPGFPIIVCTGFSDTFDEKKAIDLGVMEYVTKPYNFKELSVIAAKYIKKTVSA